MRNISISTYNLSIMSYTINFTVGDKLMRLLHLYKINKKNNKESHKNVRIGNNQKLFNLTISYYRLAK